MRKDVLRNLAGVGRSTHLPRRMGDAPVVTGEAGVNTGTGAQTGRCGGGHRR